jgi:hypothetical protein
MTVIKSNAIRKSARDQDCTVMIAGVCNYQPEKSVFAHIPSPIQGYKSSDLGGGVIACSACHDAIDRRVINDDFEDERFWYLLRAVQRTLDVLHKNGVVKVKGA